MGLLCSKLRCCYCCCCGWCCRCGHASHAATSPPPPSLLHAYKVLLLGATGSGKTELGLLLSGQPRAAVDHEATNGVRCYRSTTTPLGIAHTAQLMLTEVGGTVDMQRLWPHYYAATHSLIFCFDLSASYAALQASMALLQRCLMHESLQGKPVLLVATRHCDGVQLYDVEHAFALDELARRYGCPLHICQFDGAAMVNASLWHGIDWLQRQLRLLAPTLTQRIKYDVNLQNWQRRKRTLLSSGKLAQVRRQRFRRQYRKLWPLNQPEAARPGTAPATVFYIRTVEPTTVI